MINIYCIETPDGKKYIGQTSKSLDERFSCGWGYYSTNKGLHEAIQRFGKDSCLNSILNVTESQSEADELERYYIRLFDTTNPKNGYNRYAGGKSGFKISEYAKSVFSLNRTGKKHTDEEKIKISRGGKGRIVSPESRILISKSKKKKICIIDISTNEVVKRYDSNKEASEDTGFSMAYISSLCHNKKVLNPNKYSFKVSFDNEVM